MITFADGQYPPILNVVQAFEIPHIKFNNSALFHKDGDEDDYSFDKMFYLMGEENFMELRKIKPMSLQLTGMQLEALTQGLQRNTSTYRS